MVIEPILSFFHIRWWEEGKLKPCDKNIKEKEAHNIRKGWWVDKSGQQDHSSTDNPK
ncbi:MAG: hypothetical protein V1714_03910 [Pseudomonadota bacterium]